MECERSKCGVHVVQMGQGESNPSLIDVVAFLEGCRRTEVPEGLRPTPHPSVPSEHLCDLSLCRWVRPDALPHDLVVDLSRAREREYPNHADRRGIGRAIPGGDRPRTGEPGLHEASPIQPALAAHDPGDVRERKGHELYPAATSGLPVLGVHADQPRRRFQRTVRGPGSLALGRLPPALYPASRPVRR